MYFRAIYRQNSNLQKVQCLVISQTYTTAKAFLKNVGNKLSSYKPAPKSQHTISKILSLSQKSPQNLRLASCTPTVGLENYLKLPRQNLFLILVFPVPMSPTMTTLIFKSHSLLDSIIIIKNQIKLQIRYTPYNIRRLVKINQSSIFVKNSSRSTFLKISRISQTKIMKFFCFQLNLSQSYKYINKNLSKIKIKQATKMSHDAQQIDFDQYELVPIEDPIRKLIPDHKAQMNSRPYCRSTEHSKTSDGKIEEIKEKYQEVLKEKDSKLQQFQHQIRETCQFLNLQKQKSSKFKSIIDDIKVIIGKQRIQDSDLLSQIKKLTQSLQQIKKQRQQPRPEPTSIQSYDVSSIEVQLERTQRQLANVRSKLLQSTQNNINTIFHTSLGENASLLQEIRELKEDINKLSSSHSNYMHMNMPNMGHGLPLAYPQLGLIGLTQLNQCKHEEKLKGLIKKYEQMIQLYHSNQRYMEEMKERQQEHFAYFSAIKSQINNSIYKVCGQYTNKRLSDLENKISQFARQKKIEKQQQQQPSILSSEHTKITQLRQQNFNLTQQLTLTKSQIGQLTTQLLKKSQAYQKSKDELKTLQKLPQQLSKKLQQRDKRIHELQNTIIDHIDSKTRLKIKDDSINSEESDIEKQKINIRNLKTLVNFLKEENNGVKAKVQDLERENFQLKKKIAKGTGAATWTQNMEGIEVVSKDQASIKVVEDIVQVLVTAANEEQGCKCKCLELTADCLMGLNEQYPQLQSILEGLGIVQKTSNLLPFSF